MLRNLPGNSKHSYCSNGTSGNSNDSRLHNSSKGLNRACSKSLSTCKNLLAELDPSDHRMEGLAESQEEMPVFKFFGG